MRNNVESVPVALGIGDLMVLMLHKTEVQEEAPNRLRSADICPQHQAANPGQCRFVNCKVLWRDYYRAYTWITIMARCYGPRAVGTQ